MSTSSYAAAPREPTHSTYEDILQALVGIRLMVSAGSNLTPIIPDLDDLIERATAELSTNSNKV
jgi:hypothetical protein